MSSAHNVIGNTELGFSSDKDPVKNWGSWRYALHPAVPSIEKNTLSADAANNGILP